MTRPAMRAALEARWLALWHRLGGRGRGQTEFAALVEHHAEPARHYHTLEHVAECLRELDRARHVAERPDEAEIALWFHDAVYDPRASDNEARSAVLAEQVLADAGIGAAARARVADMIRATAHAAPPPPGDAALVCDADLAILGAPANRYDRYVRLIRAEYAWVPAPLFRRRRSAVLAQFLERTAIYATAMFRERYEDAARRNLGAELQELGR